MNSPEFRQADETLTVEQRLARLGLSPEALGGQDILVMHGGDPIIGEESDQIGAKSVMGYDPSEYDIDDDELPFRENRFDLVLADNGMLRDGLGDQVSTDMLCELIRVCKSQIRIYDAFSGYTYKNLNELPDNISYWLQDNTDHRVDVTNVLPDGQDRPYLQITKKGNPASSE